MDLRAKIIAAIERNCSEGASGDLIGAGDAADDILDEIRAEGQDALVRKAAEIEADAERIRQRIRDGQIGPNDWSKL